MTPLDAWVLGMVEGITEYLPVSSTGHLIITSWLLGLDRTEAQRAAVHDFEIIIQGGAILAVLGLYRARVAQMARGARNVMIAFVPSAAIGFAAKDWIKGNLFNPAAVVTALAVGGVVMLAMAPWQARRLQSPGMPIERMTAGHALFVGLMQCLALWPGTSRSFATILGGLLIGLGGVAAAEFSFLLGLVTLTAASGYSALKIVKAGETDVFLAEIGGWLPLACGLLVSWASAALAVDFLVRYLGKHTLALFGWWRLAVAGAVLAASWLLGLTLSP
jgi:undecaprenyl-diphosphatase